MKTLYEVISENEDHTKLIYAVNENLELSDIPEIAQYGINNGYGNFIYYEDTAFFAKKYRKEIIYFLLYISKNSGLKWWSFMDFYSIFFKNIEESEINKYLFFDTCEDKITLNAFCWTAVQAVCELF